MTNGNDCAFPFHGVPEGLTKREYFAAMVLQGIVSTDEYMDFQAVDKALSIADYLIKQLNQPQEN